MKKIILLAGILCTAPAFSQQAHTAVWAITATSCTTATPCTTAIWRVAMSGNSTCPAAGNVAYINVQPALVPLPGNVTPTGTHWDYTDTGASLTNGSTYCGYSTVTSGGVVSAPSAIFQGTIPTPMSPPTNVVTLK